MMGVPMIGHGQSGQPKFDKSVEKFKKQSLERILEKAGNIAREQDKLFQPNTKHLVFAMLDDVVDTAMLSRALMAHIQALQEQVDNLTADLEALRRAQNNDAKV